MRWDYSDKLLQSKAVVKFEKKEDHSTEVPVVKVHQADHRAKKPSNFD